ncbi:hypothetical protein F4819DRAFT_69330 [Hypoxylon fuscum]|nr:hypothetical protein F4819DRAFT_69330 [Hypoxylon fuscum]
MDTKKLGTTWQMLVLSLNRVIGDPETHPQWPDYGPYGHHKRNLRVVHPSVIRRNSTTPFHVCRGFIHLKPLNGHDLIQQI